MKFKVGSPPSFDVSKKAVLEYTVVCLEIVHNREGFRRFYVDEPKSKPFSEKLGPTLVRNVFWYMHHRLFHREDLRVLNHLQRQISLSYVGYLEILGSTKDMFFKFLPFAVASSVCLSYYYLCPASRHLYTRRFRDCLFIECFRLLTVSLLFVVYYCVPI